MGNVINSHDLMVLVSWFVVALVVWGSVALSCIDSDK